MLKHLYIKNFALIDILDIDLYPGFSVITGETGAGKSIILGAIGLLLGQRADLKTLKQGADKCVIEAHFDLSRYQMEPFFKELTAQKIWIFSPNGLLHTERKNARTQWAILFFLTELPLIIQVLLFQTSRRRMQSQ